ncbi:MULTISPECIES: protease modulator HflC [unclassified Colwellia]|jgi:membrane protease subunit HflC|uniref:protease modulator HflC n=1 Tax=unclassified Colwellia TaxID=196834 RepID=UPI0015F66793|nr:MULTISPECIES: protease modulator HflC [unclassified Colwellia]MBA6348630.1 protease modulator HflC [Colwellia sp. BRX8-9]MBA6352824.1 protease modulator HflC [Colwellia sp. BRX9-1]MBA6356323.1 protease modulator HflC [Colwellia sp. BRX8-3]MBA6360149.1 protease modulator HflC [Colwellia sp. BRX8-6]MBA6369204.1 protease modulator HflC [Colwellia sp. BRX8-5]|tara:strand:- start:118 stop:1005 length:888 start_codon:yes stop_codon:yes gene_type:complete
MKNFIIALIVLFSVLTVSSVFIVFEGQRGIVFQFTKIKRDANSGEMLVYEPGLHFKIPFINNVRRLDARIQTLDEAPDRFVTSEKKDLMVDSFVKWRIVDFSTFYLRTSGSVENARALLKQKVNNGLRTEFGTRTIKEIVSGDRDGIMAKALASASSSREDLGIEVIDVRIKAINLPAEVSASIYDRMRAERTAVAKEHRSKGQEQAEIIRATIDSKVTVMLATAQKEAQEMRGEGDALAAKVYADSYGQDPEFFSFYRSLEAYEKSFSSKSDILVVKPDSDFFNYLKEGATIKK